VFRAGIERIVIGVKQIGPEATRRLQMNSQSSAQPQATARRIQVTRRPRRRETFPDTTVTESWPPRLNTAL
jgi:hypothetical protein